MPDGPPTPDSYLDALRVLDAASTYSFEPSAAFHAALAQLDGMDAEQLRYAAAAMGTLAASYARLETLAWLYRVKVDYHTWMRYTHCQVIEGEEP